MTNWEHETEEKGVISKCGYIYKLFLYTCCMIADVFEQNYSCSQG